MCFARYERKVFENRQKQSLFCWARRSSGSEFQTVAPITAKARGPSVVSRCRSTTNCRRLADRKRCGPTTSETTGVQQSTRYFGALPCRHRCIIKTSLYVTRSGTSSQCSSSCMSVVRSRSYFLLPMSTRGAALVAACSWQDLALQRVQRRSSPHSTRYVTKELMQPVKACLTDVGTWKRSYVDRDPARLSLRADGCVRSPPQCLHPAVNNIIMQVVSSLK